MKMRQVKHYFNLIEIALALAVLAIGMSSALLMFVAGANTSRKSMDESYIADAYSEIFSRIRQHALSYAPSESDENWDIFKDSEADAGLTNTYKVENVDSDDTGDEKYFKVIDDTKYLFRKYGPANEVIFSALIVVRRDKSEGNESGLGEEYFLDHDGTQKQLKELDTEAVNITKKIILPLTVTIGYPADIPWEKQEKKTFHIEIYNEKFRLANP